MQLYKIWAVFVLSITSVGRDQYCQYPPVQWQKSCYYYQQVYFSMGLCSGLEKSTWSTAQEMIHSPPYRFRCGLDRNLATIMKKCVVQYIQSSEKVHKHSYILLKSNCKRKQSVSSSWHIVSEEEKTHLWTVLGLINWKKVKIEPKIRIYISWCHVVWGGAESLICITDET